MALIGRKDTSDPAASPRRNRSNRAEETGPTFADDPLDPMLDVKKRARRRLVGAFALVIGAIVFVPMVFEPQSRPVVDDISIQIPDKNTRFEQTAPARPAVAAPEPVTPAPLTEPSAASETTQAQGDPPGPTATANSEPMADKSPATKSAEAKLAEPKAETKAETKITEPAKSITDDARAVALLEGKSASGEAKADSYAVQIGAFSDAVKLKSLREKLSSGGFKTYTEVVKTTQGERTRLRLGPYPSRAEADKVQERVKKLFVLDATVVPL